MANDQNQCNFTGRLGREPEMKQLQSGSVTNFSIAVGEQWRDRQTQEKKERTTWVDCVAYGALADIVAKYATKGTFVRITGKLQKRSWEHDGQTRYATEIVVGDLQLLSSPSQSQHGGQQTQHAGQPRPQPQSPARQPDFDDDIPF